MPTPIGKIKLKDTAQARTMQLRANAEHDGKRFDSDFYVEGYAARYEQYLLYDDGDRGKVYERFERGCFDGCDMSDVIMQHDHRGLVYARNTDGTLIVEPDGSGLFIAADLSGTINSRAYYEDIAAGLITRMIWRFIPGTCCIERAEGSKDVCIVHKSIRKIYDVSGVSIPVKDEIEINARAWCDGVIAPAARSEAELDDKKRRLRLKIKLMEVTHGQTE